jgi:pSer/pThr/pTyr-binding forkhead associated (FHA) protein
MARHPIWKAAGLSRVAQRCFGRVHHPALDVRRAHPLFSAPVAGEINLEVIEGPDAGKQIIIDRPIVIGRDPTSDFVLADGEVSGQHARITPSPDGSATVEDLESTNGTFVNQNELEGPAHLDAGDELLLGVSVLQLRSVDDFRARGSGVIQLPPGLAMEERTPTYVNPEVARVDQVAAQPSATPAGHPTVDKYLDVRVRKRANLAPVAFLVLICIALVLYFSLK